MRFERIGGYAVTAKIGEGGMGEVYQARDTRLDRTVAIKVLPEHVAADPDLKARFEREAKAIAGLNHPHICTLHDIGTEGDTDFLVMEYLDGQTLAQRLEKGPLPLQEALEVAIAIADALDKAHRQGIVHRDLKPGNIILTKSGAKLLDFGLAKLKDAGGAGVEGVSAQASQKEPLTTQGSILGTLQYMAPEQLEGRNVDARSDVFAFGTVVYEMVTGRKAFEGDSQASLIGAILHTVPPPLSALEPTTAPPFDRLVAKCLAKDPDRRWQAASDLVDELRWLSERPAAGPTGAAVAPGRTTWRGAWVLAGSLAAVAVAGLLLTRAPGMPWRAAPTLRSTGLTFTPFSFEQGGQRGAVWAPDGSAVAFAARQAVTDPFQVYVRDLDSPVPRQITDLDVSAIPIEWTSTGRIVFRSRQAPAGLWSVSPVGGEPEPLQAGASGSASVSRDGMTVAWLRRGDDAVFRLWVSSPPGADPQPYEPAPFASRSFFNVPTVKFHRTARRSS